MIWYMIWSDMIWYDLWISVKWYMIYDMIWYEKSWYVLHVCLFFRFPGFMFIVYVWMFGYLFWFDLIFHIFHNWFKRQQWYYSSCGRSSRHPWWFLPHRKALSRNECKKHKLSKIHKMLIIKWKMNTHAAKIIKLFRTEHWNTRYFHLIYFNLF